MQRLVIIGGGASGIFCAVNAARLCPDLHVLVLEKSSKLLAKVKISGGGRCNLTHHEFDIKKLIENYPRGKNFLKKELYQFSPKDVIEWFEKRAVKIKTEKDGRVFPVSNSSQTIIDCLLKEAQKYNIEINPKTSVLQVSFEGEKYILHTERQKYMADFLVIACGGFPKIEQFLWMKALKHTIQPPVPSLFSFNVMDIKIKELMGVSVQDVQVKIVETKLKTSGAILITHWGFSGPVILRLSAWGARILAERNYAFHIQVNWTKDYSDTALRAIWNEIREKYSTQKIGNKNPFLLPARLWNYLLRKAEISTEIYWSEMSSKTQNKLINVLTADVYEVKGKTTYKEEFVTAGGIHLSEINAATMESRLHENLFFTGEIMDVDGITGGFNFQHAWASGMIAAQHIARRLLNK